MPLITIADELTHLTGGYSSIDILSSSVKECLSQLFSRYPQLYIFIMDNQAVESQRIMLILNDDELLEHSDMNRLLNDGDTLHIYYGVPTGQYGQVIVTALEFAVEYALPAMVSQALAAIVNMAIMMAVSYAVGAIIGALVDDVATPDSTIASTSVNYTFDGIKNGTVSGTPIGIIYGTHRTGGMVLSMFTEQTSNSAYNTYTTHLLYQLGLSEGEVASISDFEINKLPYTYFNGVTFDNTKLGTRDQPVMLDFNKIESTVSLGRKILNINSPPTPPTRLTTSTEPVYGYVDNVTRWGWVGPYVWTVLDPVA